MYCNFQGSPRLAYRALIRPELDRAHLLGCCNLAISRLYLGSFQSHSNIHLFNRSNAVCAALSLSCSPFATRRILFLDSGERASERGGLAKALDRNERPFCAALRWARSLSRSVGRTRLWCNAIIHRQSTVVCRLGTHSGDALMMMMMLTAFARVFAVNSACEDHSLKLAKTLISQERDEHGGRRERGERSERVPSFVSVSEL